MTNATRHIKGMILSSIRHDINNTKIKYTKYINSLECLTQEEKIELQAFLNTTIQKRMKWNNERK